MRVVTQKVTAAAAPSAGDPSLCLGQGDELLVGEVAVAEIANTKSECRDETCEDCIERHATPKPRPFTRHFGRKIACSIIGTRLRKGMRAFGAFSWRLQFERAAIWGSTRR
jgi:hypothetical protein